MLKKLLVLFLAFVMIFSLVSCIGEEKPKDGVIVDTPDVDDKDTDGDTQDEDDRSDVDDNDDTSDDDENDRSDNDDTSDDGETENLPFIETVKLNYDVYQPMELKTASTDGTDYLYPMYVDYLSSTVHFDFGDEGSIKINKTFESEGLQVTFKSLDRMVDEYSGKYMDMYYFVVELTNLSDDTISVDDFVDCKIDNRAVLGSFDYQYDEETGKASTTLSHHLEPNEKRIWWLFTDNTGDEEVLDFNNITGYIETDRQNNHQITVPFSIDVKDVVNPEYPYDNLGYEIYNKDGVSLRIVGYNVFESVSDGYLLHIYVYAKNDTENKFTLDTTWEMAVNGEKVSNDLTTCFYVPGSCGLSHIIVKVKDIALNSEGFIDDTTIQLNFEPYTLYGESLPEIFTDTYTFKFAKEIIGMG